MNRWITFLILLTGLILQIPESHSLENQPIPCGSTEVTGGYACLTLKVRFNFNQCEDPEINQLNQQIVDSYPQMECFKKEGFATFKKDQFLYLVRVVSNPDGQWRTDGSIIRTHISNPKYHLNKRALASTLHPFFDPSEDVPTHLPILPNSKFAKDNTNSPLKSDPHPDSPSANHSDSKPKTHLQTSLSPAPNLVQETIKPKFPAFEIHGSARFRQEESRLQDLATHRGFGLTRLRLDLTVKASPHLTFFFQPQFANTMGEPFFTPLAAGGTNANSLTVASGNTADTSVLFHQGYFKYQPTGWLNFTFGRQVIKFGDELVVGQLNWGNLGRSFDALRMQIGNEDHKVELFGAKVRDNNTRATFANFAGDQDFYGIYSSNHNWRSIDEIDFYFFFLHDAPAQHQVALLGARISDQMTSYLDYRIEAGQEGASAHGGQFDGEIGFSIPSALNPRIAFQAYHAGKDYYQLYPGWHSWIGYADLFGRRNVAGHAIHASIDPYPGAKLVVSYHNINRADPNAPAYKINGFATWGNPKVSSSTELAQEIDVTFKTPLPYGLGMTLGVSPVFLDEFLSTQYGNLTPWFYYAQVQAKF